MDRASATAAGFRATLQRPLLTVAEIGWRWTAGATAIAVFFFGLFEYLNTLPVTYGELLFLRTRHPYLVSQAIAHILRGSMGRVLVAGAIAALTVTLLWIAAASAGRIAIIRSLLDYFRRDVGASTALASLSAGDVASNVSTSKSSLGIPALLGLNFLRAGVALAAFVAFLGASIVAGYASPDSDPQPGLAFMIFLLLAALICLAWWALNWLLSLAGMFAVRDEQDALGAISAAVSFCRERTGAVFAVSTWTGLAHLVAFVGASMIVSLPLGLAGALPWRAVVFCMTLVTLAYFAVADWLYMARLAGYVCIAEMPEALPVPLPPIPLPTPPRVAPPIPVQTTIDRDALILSDKPDSVPRE